MQLRLHTFPLVKAHHFMVSQITHSQARKFTILDDSFSETKREGGFFDKLIYVRCNLSGQVGYILISHGCRFNEELKQQATFLGGCNPWQDDPRLVLGLHSAYELYVDASWDCNEMIVYIECLKGKPLRLPNQVESESYFLTKAVKEEIESACKTLRCYKDCPLQTVERVINFLSKKYGNDCDSLRFVWYVLYFNEYGKLKEYSASSEYKLIYRS